MSIINKKIGEVYRSLVTLELENRLSESADVLVLGYRHLKSPEMTLLRRGLKNVGCTVLVTKNTFMRKVFQDAKKISIEAAFMVEGPTALIFVKGDPIAASKAIIKFAKEHEALQIRGGVFRQRLITPEDIKFLSSLFSQQAVYQRVASTLNAPVGKLARSLNQITAKLVYVLKAVGDKKR